MSIETSSSAVGCHAAVVDDQARQNRSTSGQWQLFASHRRNLERLLVPEEPERGARICVLGAGNCNDLDLKWLMQVYTQVHLVDIDPGAVSEGLRRQGVLDSATMAESAKDNNAVATVPATQMNASR